MKMEKSRRRSTNNRGLEENTLAILDSFCALDSSHVHDDRLAFLEAVRFASIVPKDGAPPTNKMMEAIFEIMREAKSLELIVSSYELLCELEKHFPRVYLSEEDDKEASPRKPAQLVVFEEAWTPFAVGSDVASSDNHAANKGSKEPISSAGFQLLLQNLSEVDNEEELFETKVQLELLAKMFLFQYLVYILESDFSPQHTSWISLRDSLLNKLLGSRRINYKDLVKDSLFALCNLFRALPPMNHDTQTANTFDNSESALALSLPEVEKCTHKAAQKLLLMMMELDMLRKKADTQGLTKRADSVRTPVVELIMDALSYDKDMISPFLQAFDEPRLKLDMVSQYIQKYNVKPSTRKRKSDSSQEDGATTKFFKCFLNITSTKGIVKKLGAETIQVLLAHALQAAMSISKEQLLEENSDLKDDAGSSPLVKDDAGSSPLVIFCKNIISAFTKLRETDENLQILPIGKEALFTATTILSTTA